MLEKLGNLDEGAVRVLVVLRIADPGDFGRETTADSDALLAATDSALFLSDGDLAPRVMPGVGRGIVGGLGRGVAGVLGSCCGCLMIYPWPTMRTPLLR